MAKVKNDDQIFQAAKSKLGQLLEAKDITVTDAVSICNTLAKMKAVELKASDGGYGDGLPMGDEPS